MSQHASSEVKRWTARILDHTSNMSDSNPNNSNNSKHALYLQEINIETKFTGKFDLELKNGDSSVRLQRDKDVQTYTLSPGLEVLDTSVLTLIAIGDRKLSIKKRSIIRLEATISVAGQQLMEEFWKNEGILTVGTIFQKQSFKATFVFQPSTVAKNTRDITEKLRAAMKDYKPMLSDSTVMVIDSAFGVGEVFAKLNPIAEAAFGIAKKTFELLKEQQKCDAQVAELAKGIEEILPYANHAMDEDTVQMVDDDLVNDTVKKLYALVGETAGYLMEYVQHGRAYRAVKSLVSEDTETINELAEQFTKMKESFDRALNVEALKKARSIDDNFILDRLKPTTNAGYKEALKCMEGTRKEVLKNVTDWTIDPLSTRTKPIYWIHGSPGLGKTALATSLCLNLHRIGRLGGSFFCRRDNPILSKPESILPALIHRLVRMWAPYGKAVAQALRDDPQLDAETSSELLTKLLLGPLNSLKKQPPHCLVIVIDAIDECGDDRTRKVVLMALSKIVSQAPWLRMVITSRPERDISSFFERTYPLGADTICNLVQIQTADDIRSFARESFGSIPDAPPDWPGKEKIEQIVIRSKGLFMYMTTVDKILRDALDCDETLEQVLKGEVKDSATVLDHLYEQAIDLAFGERHEQLEALRAVVGAIIVISGHRPLGDATLAALLGLKATLVTNLLGKLNCLFERDKDNVIRARHLSILEFFTSTVTSPKYRIDVKAENAKMATHCLTTMHKELKFNICQLETSSRLNSQVEDLSDRVERYISDALQYSCVHWASHVCSSDLTTPISEHLEAILGCEKALYWLEVLSLLGKMPGGESALRKLKESIKMPQGLCRQLATDLLRFVMAFYTPIANSVPHIYLSALPFAPTESTISINTKASFQNLLNVTEGRLTAWSSCPLEWHGHTSKVTNVAYSPDGRRVVSASRDRTIRIWDPQTGQLIGEPLKGHTDSVWTVKYSPDGSRIVSCSEDQTIRIWDAETGHTIGEPLKGHTDSVTSVAYSPDGSHIVSGSVDTTLRIWDAETGQAIGGPLEGHTDVVWSVSYSPDGYRIVSGSEDQNLRIWDAETGQAIGEPLKGHTGTILSVGYSPDGFRIVSGSEDNTVRIWNAESRRVIGEPLIGHTGDVWSVGYSPDGFRIVSGSEDNTLRIWDAESGQSIGEPLIGHTEAVMSVEYSPDGFCIVSGSYDLAIRTWDAETGLAIGEPLKGHGKNVIGIKYSPDGSRIVSASYDSTIRIWDAETGHAIGEPLKGHTGSVWSVGYSPDGSRIVSGSADETLRIWDVESGQSIGEPLNGHTETVTSVEYSPDGFRIVSGSGDETIRIWDAEARHTICKPLEGHTDTVTCVSYSPDGSCIVSSSMDNTLRIWDVETGQVISGPLNGHTRKVRIVRYSPDGSHIVSGSYDHTIRIWDAETGQAIGNPLEGHTGPVMDVQYSPDGLRLISGSMDQTIRVWDAKTGQAIGEPLKAHNRTVASVCYSPDGSRIASGSFDRTIRIWDPLKASSSTLDAAIGIDIDAKLNENGWVQYGDKLLFWVPEDSRSGFIGPLLTIPNAGHYRMVRVDASQMSYGTSWTNIWRGSS